MSFFLIKRKVIPANFLNPMLWIIGLSWDITKKDKSAQGHLVVVVVVVVVVFLFIQRVFAKRHVSS